MKTGLAGLESKDFAAVPGEVGGVGTESGLGCERERTAVEVGEFEVGAARNDGFGDIGLGYSDAEVVIDGPEAGVEEIVGAPHDNGVRPHYEW